MKVTNKHVESYHFEVYQSGIAALIINTNERWAKYQFRNDTMYTFYTNEDDDDIGEDFFIPESTFDNFDTSDCMTSTSQEKDQIIVFYIPFDMITERK